MVLVDWIFENFLELAFTSFIYWNSKLIFYDREATISESWITIEKIKLCSSAAVCTESVRMLEYCELRYNQNNCAIGTVLITRIWRLGNWVPWEYKDVCTVVGAINITYFTGFNLVILYFII